MKGELTFDKSSQNVSLLLYSVFLIHKYGEDDCIRRNYDSNSFVERMASFIGTKAYNKDGREERTVFNKSLYAQYYGFISRYKDDKNREWLQLTQRGRLLLPLIAEDENESSCYSRFYIKQENRHYVQDMLWASAVFDPHGKHNAGAQTSNTDVDPLGVIFRCLFSLGYASNDEIFYVIFGLNKGDSGNESIDKSFTELIDDIKAKRENKDYDYSDFFKQWRVVNKVNDAKVINILADPNFYIIAKKDNADGIECNYLSDSCTRFLSQSKIISEAASPTQMFIYSKSYATAHKWIYETVLGRYKNPSKFCIEVPINTHAPELTNFCEKAHNIAIGNPGLDFYIIVEAINEIDFAEKLKNFLPLIERDSNLNSNHFGCSVNSIQSPNIETLKFPSNLHILALFPMSDTISTNPIFDGQFKRLNVEESSNFSLPEAVSDYSNYVELLLKNHNLVLTGAPGTGKTFLAKQIAATMVGGCEWKALTEEQKKHIRFVQFHPSYDYTDFVEGLRPDKKGNFVRTDGDFKEFCKLAIQGNACADSSSTSFESVYQSLVNDVKEGIITEYTRRSGDKRQVSVGADGRLKFQFTEEEMRSESVENGKLFYEYFLEHPEISPESLNRKEYGELIEKLTSGREKVTHSVDDGVYCWLLRQLLDRTGSNNLIDIEQTLDCSDNNSPYIFIIDEINRGEISKIFGELFYSIEKDYRGDETLVRTQYNNMVEPSDVFFKGFYVPKNVYIIGTMNDIDRGVEAMDFAIRRRFAWREVTAEESAINMGIIGKALLKMNALNQALLDANLNEAFFIGGAYFRHVKDEDFINLWNYHLKGIVFEYFRGDPDANDKITAIEKAYNDAGEVETRTEVDAATTEDAAE